MVALANIEGLTAMYRVIPPLRHRSRCRAGPRHFHQLQERAAQLAARLASDLQRYGYDVFLDHDTAAGLRARDPWEQTLKSAVEGAKHFLLLWSGLITVGSYVHKEIDIRRQAKVT